MISNYSNKQKMKEFFSRYGYLLAILGGVLVLTLLIIISATVSNTNTNTNQEQDNQVPVSSAITFTMPVLDATIYKGYNGSELVYNSTLKQWEAHKSIDFQVSSNSNVYAVMEGTVSEVYTNYLEGTVVVITHDNGLKTSYGSLAENVKVSKGDTIKKGDIIGSASDSASRESGIGAYLHFTTYDNDKKIDPAGYLNMELK